LTTRVAITTVLHYRADCDGPDSFFCNSIWVESTSKTYLIFFAVCRRSSVCLSVVCMSVPFLRPTQTI